MRERDVSDAGCSPGLKNLSWSVSLRDRQDSDIERDVAALVEAIGLALAEQFPEAGGYETVWSRLSGPIEGATVRVCRGRFRASASVQRFARAHASVDMLGRAVEVRLVATAEIAPPAGSAMVGGPARRLENAGSGSWAAASCALGTAAFGAVALGAAGLLTAWAQVLLLLPTFIVWRTTLALARPPAPSIGALAGASLRQSPRPRPRDPTLDDALARWRRARAQLEAHRQLLEDKSSLAPFRVPPRSLGATG